MKFSKILAGTALACMLTASFPSAVSNSSNTVLAAKKKYDGNFFKKTDAKHKNLLAKKAYSLHGLYKLVVQKHYQDGSEVYALQIKKGQIVVRRGRLIKKNVRFPGASQSLTIRDGQHTQTFEKDGKNWLVGVTPKADPYSNFTWTTELARVNFDYKDYSSQSLPRLTDLYSASDDGSFTASDLQRFEAAVSPNQRYLLICGFQYPDKQGGLQTLHFGLYDLRQINQLFDQAQHSDNKAISLSKLQPLSAFHLSHSFGPKGAIKSVQGLSIGNDRQIYIAGENAPHWSGKRYVSSQPRELIRIPWGQRSSKKWAFARVNNPDRSKWAVEFEGTQIRGKSLFLNVAYHDPKTYKTKKNVVFRIQGFVK